LVVVVVTVVEVIGCSERSRVVLYHINYIRQEMQPRAMYQLHHPPPYY